VSRGEEIAAPGGREGIAPPGHVMTEREAAMQRHRAIQARFGRFEDWTPEQVAYLIGELADGMARDWRRRFDGYWGAAAALRIARSFVLFGDSPEANEEAAAEIGILARYALDSVYWGNEEAPVRPATCDPEHRPLVKALEAIEHAASPIVKRTGTVDWDGLQRRARGA